MSALDTIRDALFGNPPVAGFKPSREGVQAAFAEMYAMALSATTGIALYNTKALMDADTTRAPGTQARVTADATSANNKNYIRNSAGTAWVADTEFYNAIAAVVQPLVTLAQHYANDNVNTDVPGGSTGERGAKFWATLAGAFANGSTDVAVPNQADSTARGAKYWSIVAQAAATAAATSAASSTEIQNAGGVKNLWPDPFHLELNVVANGGFRSGLASAFTPFTFGASAPTWVYGNASALSPYPDGKMITRPSGNVATPVIQLFLDRLALQAGDVIEFSQEMAYSTAVSTSSGSVGSYQFLDGAGGAVGSAVNLFNLTSGAGALNNTPKRFTTGAITIPAGARALKFSYTLWGAGAIEIYSTWMHKNSTLTKPIANMSPPDQLSRFQALESRDPTANNILLKQIAYSSVATVIAPTGPALNTTSALVGMASCFVTASIPAGGFNAIQQIFNWDTASIGPSRIYCQIRTAAAGSNAINGKLIAEGWIGADPNALSTGLQNVLLYDAITGLPRTVQATDSDMLARYAVIYYGVKSDGSYAANMWVNYATVADGDAAFPGYYQSGVPVGQGSATQISSSTSQYLAANRVLVTTPVVVYVPSLTFVNNVSTKGEQSPDIIGLPTKIYGVEGRAMCIYFDNIEHRRWEGTNFRIPGMVYGSFLPDHWEYTPGSTARNQAMTITAYRGEQLISTGATTIITAALSASAGTKLLHVVGDSITNNGSFLTSYQSLDAGDTTSNTSYIGTQSTTNSNGTFKRDGYSGMGAGAINAATIAGYGTNPFYNPGTSAFDYAYYITNQNSGVYPDAVFFAFGTNDMDPASSVMSDDAALQRAQGVAGIYETYITNIKAANAATKVVIMSPLATAGEQDLITNNSRDAFWRFERNLKVFAKVLNAQFSGREAFGIYYLGTNAGSDRKLEYARVQVLKHGNVKVGSASPYSTFAAMLAETTAAVGTLAKATDVAQYFVKLANGSWRPATEQDGVTWRVNDGIHHSGTQMGEAMYAFRKCVLA